jgi:hypothetical protein
VERIPIELSQRNADFTKPFEWAGRFWWVKESPEFKMRENGPANVAWVYAEEYK